MALEIEQIDDGYRLVGELDIASVGGLTQVIRGAADRSEPVVLDFAGVRFMDSSGLRALLEGAGLPNDNGPLVIVNPSSQVRRLLEISIPGGMPGLEVRG
jgi:anti-anti-sigma factor